MLEFAVDEQGEPVFAPFTLLWLESRLVLDTLAPKVLSYGDPEDFDEASLDCESEFSRLLAELGVA